MKDRTLRVLEFDKIARRLSDMASSEAGMKRCLGIMPSKDLEEVERLQQETAEASYLVIKKGEPPLAGVRDLFNIFRRVEAGGILDTEQLLHVGDLLRAVRNMKNYMVAEREKEGVNYETITEMAARLVSHPQTEREIFRCIEGPGQLSDDASPALRSIRRQIASANEEIRSKMNSFISSGKFQKFLQDAIVTTRGDRYVIPVKQEYRGSVPGIVHDQSSTGATLFIEPMAVVELNNRLRELGAKEKIEIERILSALTLMVSEILDDLYSDMETLIELDYIFARAKFGLELDGSRPIYNTEGYINIMKARHPLIPRDTVVPVSVHLGKDFDILVITGPNTGGKTVTLKTVGLVILMAQSGLHVPCQEGTELTMFSDVFADIGDEQSIEQSLSTFSSHMTNIVDILRHVSRDSLVLLDELGAGTDPTEGAALAMSILDFLNRKSIKTIATTHYSELKQYALSEERVENASVEFNVETLSPTYRLTIGIPGKSNAFEISRRLGLNEDIINRAADFLSGEEVRFEDLIGDLERNKKAAEQEKEWAENIRHEVERIKAEYNAKIGKLEEKREKILDEARKEARTILEQAREESNQLIKELRNLNDVEARQRNKRIDEVRKRIKWDIEKLEEALSRGLREGGSSKPPQDIKPGDPVKVVSLGQKGTVIEKTDENEVLVQVGIMKIKVSTTNIQKVEEEKPQEILSSPRRPVSKASTFSPELDVRGQVLDDALMNVDKYLDDASLSGLKQVTIIHGKGTGVLRSGIQQLLKSHQHVASFRKGVFGEGGDGVTIVEIH
ncbi:MAG: Recombination inhibitory protein MutS2 [Firmicutes bacterium]|nr:Recombination inhibitory protein MutS2 [Bacillota bacterium]MDI6706710.1 endonuclease MutS2 [Bacillota bacterium]